MGDDLGRKTRRRATAAVVVLVLGLVIAVAAPIVGGDGFLPGFPTGWQWVSVRTSGGGPTTWVHIDALVSASPAGSTAINRMPIALFAPRDFMALVTSDPRWIAATVALVVLPLWFLWWRRCAMGFARGIGVLASAGTTAALAALAWPGLAFCAAHVLVAAPVAYLAAFLVAPPPRAPDAE